MLKFGVELDQERFNTASLLANAAKVWGSIRRTEESNASRIIRGETIKRKVIFWVLVELSEFLTEFLVKDRIQRSNGLGKVLLRGQDPCSYCIQVVPFSSEVQKVVP